MATTSQVRSWWAPMRCDYGVKMDPEWTWGRSPIRAQPAMHSAVKALFVALPASGYVPEENWPDAGYIGSARYCPHGISGRTCQENGSWCSLHNYVLALDMEYDKNPHLQVTRPDPDWMFARCKFTPENIDAIEAIRTNNGKQVWRWLGWSIGDTMHFQCNVSRTDIATGIDWSTVLGWTGEPIEPPTGGEQEGVFMAYARRGDRGDAVVEIQTFLVLMGYDLGEWGPAVDGVDGVWGNAVTAAVRDFQTGNAVTEYDSAGAAIAKGEYWGPRTAGFVAGQTGGEGVTPVDAYTKAQSDVRYAPKAHDHDGRYVKDVAVSK